MNAISESAGHSPFNTTSLRKEVALNLHSNKHKQAVQWSGPFNYKLWKRQDITKYQKIMDDPLLVEVAIDQTNI